jgi:hypothetical protein
MKRLMICHLLPLERYPPTMNLLRVLSSESELKVRVCAAKNATQRSSNFKIEGMKIFRFHQPMDATNLFSKFWSYLSMTFGPLLQMLIWKPELIFYFEPHSSFPVYLYQRFFNKKARVFIHHHEYYAKEQFYEQGMGLVRYYHQKELTYLYPKAVWISQTNQFRLDLFYKDHPFLNPDKLQVLANFPPQSWASTPIHRSTSKKLKCLYIGALSFENTYIREMVAYTMRHSGDMELHIYSNNLKADVAAFLKRYQDQGLTLVEKGIPYDAIPKLGGQFDLGLVLYKGHNLNYTYNAPNKLFEYLALGLDVLVPEQLKGCTPYYNTKTRPSVVAVDFNNLRLDLKMFRSQQLEKPLRKSLYSCEQELVPLIKALKA